jgi:hypothetical protein
MNFFKKSPPQIDWVSLFKYEIEKVLPKDYKILSQVRTYAIDGYDEKVSMYQLVWGGKVIQEFTHDSIRENFLYQIQKMIDAVVRIEIDKKYKVMEQHMTVDLFIKYTEKELREGYKLYKDTVWPGGAVIVRHNTKLIHAIEFKDIENSFVWSARQLSPYIK